MIDLGYNYKDMNGPMPESVETDKTMYPSFHVEGKEKLDIPEEGTMTIKYKKVASEHSKRNGKERYSCTVEVQGIEKVDGKSVNSTKAPAKNGSKETEDALDAIAVTVAKKNGKSEDY